MTSANLPKDFKPLPDDITLDWAKAGRAPDQVTGRGYLVYWKGCPSVTLAKQGETVAKRLKLEAGFGKLERGWVLIFIGDNARFIEE